MTNPRRLVIALAAATVLAGCVGAMDDPLDEASTEAPEAPVPETEALLGAQAVNESRLSDKVHGVLPKRVNYVDTSVPGENVGDDVELYTEVHLPDGDGPWPVILQSTPYAAFRANGEADAVVGDHRLVEDYVPRGYAVVFAHVRGTGNSEGCMNMMGAREQADQARLVEWAADRNWSNGKVAMVGASYVGTTPHEAAIQDPEGLEAVVTVAGVTNQWRNTFMNGVPYEGRHYPLTYEVLVGAPPPLDVTRGGDWATNTASGACGQGEAVEQMSPGTYEEGIYDAYWAERNLTRGAEDVTAPILYSQGFDDRAVNPSEAIHWFNDLDVPKKALLHQGGHMYPPRDDYFTLEHAWFDRWLKGIESGVTEGPTVEVLADDGAIRTGDAWPPEDPATRRWNLSEDGLVEGPAEPGSATYLADMARNPADAGDETRGTRVEPLAESPAGAAGLPSRIVWSTEPLAEPVHVAGAPTLHLEASVDARNTYFILDLYDVAPDGERRWLAEGWFNAHLREGFHRSAPLTPGETYAFTFDFEPREWVLEEGHRLQLVVRGHDDRVFPVDELVTRNTVVYGEDGSWLEVPVLEDPAVHERPDGI